METTLNNKFFDFEKAKVQTLSLDQLARTHKENDIYGKPLRGIYHYDLLNQIIGMCNAQNYDVEVYDLFAAQNKDRNTPGVVLLPQVEAQYGERAVEAHILRRVFANIRITNFDDADHTTNLAVAFHQKGIQVGFGNMVMICHNQCMRSIYLDLFGERIGSGQWCNDSRNPRHREVMDRRCPPNRRYRAGEDREDEANPYRRAADVYVDRDADRPPR